MGFFDKLKDGLNKTRKGIVTKIDEVLVSFGKIDEELFEELEDILISSDVGVNTTMKIIEAVKLDVKEKKLTEASDVRDVLKDQMRGILGVENESLDLKTTPSIILIVGVNGVGKTTSIGKIAHKLKGEGKKVMVAAADTFRAAAIEQLQIWTDRAGVDLIKHSEGADPAAVVFDAIVAAKARKTDVLICDTAGRLHTKKNLMQELGKIGRILSKELPHASKEVLLVLDATTGQNAISQAKVFKEAVDINGIVLTKLDGTAKGGVVICVKSELDVPIKFIGVGEGVDDLQSFKAEEFVDALFN